jgi:hypothetical protein
MIKGKYFATDRVISLGFGMFMAIAALTSQRQVV